MQEITKLYQKYLAEFIGTFALIFFGCGSIMLADLKPEILSVYLIPVIFGVVVATMIYTVGHISGAHFNPAVTLAFAAAKHFPAKQVIPYWAAQFLGAIFAIFILSYLIPEAKNYGATVPSVAIFPAFLWEMILSFFLMFVITAVATDTRAEGVMAGIAIGAVVTLASFIGGPFTGSSMNPARSLAPALFQGFDFIWLYFTAPFVGTILGAFTYKIIRCEKKSETAKGCC